MPRAEVVILADAIATGGVRRRRPAAAASDPRTGVIDKLAQLDARDLPKIEAWLDHLIGVRQRAHPIPSPIEDLSRRMTALHAYAAEANHRANLASERFRAVLCKCAKASLTTHVPASCADDDILDYQVRLLVNERTS